MNGKYSPTAWIKLDSTPDCRTTAAEERYEFHAGQILAMSGGTHRHGRVCTNGIAAASKRLKGSSGFALESNMRLRLTRENRYMSTRYVYPDGNIVS